MFRQALAILFLSTVAGCTVEGFTPPYQQRPTEPPATELPDTEPSPTELPATEPSPTELPATEPSATEPPVTEPAPIATSAGEPQPPALERPNVVDSTPESKQDIEYAVVGAGKNCVSSSSGVSGTCVSMKLNLHRPKSFTGSLPTIVYVPGGIGNAKDLDTDLFPPFIAKGYAWIQIDKSSDPEESGAAASRLPYHLDQIHNVKAAIRWTRANAKTYRLNPNKIILAGFSAGGYLAAFVGTTANHPDWDGRVGPHLGESTAVAAVITAPGIFELAWAEADCQELVNRGFYSSVKACFDEMHLDGIVWVGCTSSGDLASDFAACKTTLEKGSPRTHVSTDDPPFLQLVGATDQFPVAQQKRFRDALLAVGVASSLEIVKDASHHVLMDLRYADPPYAPIYTFLSNHGL